MIRFIVSAVMLLAGLSHALAGPDEDAIGHLLHDSFDKPESRLVVDPIVVVADHAVAGWTQGDRGGRALLRRAAGQWRIVLCSGDAIRSGTALRQAGLPERDAETLAHRLAVAESTIPESRRALFATFEATVMMDSENGAHRPHNGR